MNHIKSQIEERRTEKIKSLHKLYRKNYIDILIRNLVHDRHIETKHKQTNKQSSSNYKEEKKKK